LLSNLHKRTNTVLWMHEIQRMCQKAVIRYPLSVIHLPAGRPVNRTPAHADEQGRCASRVSGPTT